MKKIIVGQNENLFRQALIIRKESLLHNLLHYYTYCFFNTYSSISVPGTTKRNIDITVMHVTVTNIIVVHW